MDCSPPGPSSMGFSRQEYWNGLPLPSPNDATTWHQTEIKFASFFTASRYQWMAICFLFHNANMWVSFLRSLNELSFKVFLHKDLEDRGHRPSTIPSVLSQGPCGDGVRLNRIISRGTIQDIYATKLDNMKASKLRSRTLGLIDSWAPLLGPKLTNVLLDKCSDLSVCAKNDNKVTT